MITNAALAYHQAGQVFQRVFGIDHVDALGHLLRVDTLLRGWYLIAPEAGFRCGDGYGLFCLVCNGNHGYKENKENNGQNGEAAQQDAAIAPMQPVRV